MMKQPDVPIPIKLQQDYLYRLKKMLIIVEINY